MKSMTAIGILLALCIESDALAQEDVYTFLGETFEASITEPNKFDQFVERNEARFNENFWSCHSLALDEYGSRGQEHMDGCNHLSGQAHYRCINQNQAAMVAYWLLNIRYMFEQDLLWTETRLGRAVIEGREQKDHICRQLGICVTAFTDALIQHGKSTLYCR